MATKTFGIQPTLNNAYWGGVPYHANIGLRATMPERGKILSLSLKLARVNDSDVPIVWGAIWNRSNGTLLAQSNHTHSPTNTFTTPGNMGIYTFAFDQPQIEEHCIMESIPAPVAVQLTATMIVKVHQPLPLPLTPPTAIMRCGSK
jgi:hypothetical protein